MPNVSAKQAKQIPLFADLDRDDLKAVAKLFHREDYPAGSVICRQGEVGRAAYFVEDGELRVLHVDPEGIEQEVARLEPGEYFGETSLLLGEPHDATVEVIQHAILLYVNKEDFDQLLEERPWLLDALRMRPDVERKKHAPHFKWQSPEETVILSLHKHGVTLIRSLILPCLMLLTIFSGCTYWYLKSYSFLPLIVGVIIALPLLVFGLYLIVDHYNDDYILTNKRVVHEERVFLIRESRAEAPLRNIQNIQQIREGIWAQLFNLGDLIIETAGEHGVVIFRQIPSPAAVQDAILDQVQREQARARAEERAAVRDALRRRFGEVPPEDETPPEPEPSPQGRSALRPPSWLLAPLRLFRYFVPSLRYEEGDTITWRKHWVALIAPIALPTGLMTFITLATIVLLYLAPAGGATSSILIGYGLAMIFLFLWWLWVFEDWRNDVYQVTSSRIIDVEQTPFALREERREASLGRIQNISLEIPSLLGRLLHYGSVTIETAGAGAFTFDQVKNPREVQNELFRRIETFEQRQRQQETKRRRDELLDWFSVYDQLHRSTSSGMQPPPQQQEA